MISRNANVGILSGMGRRMQGLVEEDVITEEERTRHARRKLNVNWVTIKTPPVWLIQVTTTKTYASVKRVIHVRLPL
jgi:hypothetical protein